MLLDIRITIWAMATMVCQFMVPCNPTEATRFMFLQITGTQRLSTTTPQATLPILLSTTPHRNMRARPTHNNPPNITRASLLRLTMLTNLLRSIIRPSRSPHRSTRLPHRLTHIVNHLKHIHPINKCLPHNNTPNPMSPLLILQHNPLKQPHPRHNHSPSILSPRLRYSILLFRFRLLRRVTLLFSSQRIALSHSTTLRGEHLLLLRFRRMDKQHHSLSIQPIFLNPRTMSPIRSFQQAQVSVTRVSF